MLPSIMYREREFEFQIAARKRAAGDQLRSACSLAAKRPPQASTFLAAFAPRTLPKLGHGSPFTIHQSRVTSHAILIETPRLEFPATATKQSSGRISNRVQNRMFSLRDCPPRHEIGAAPPPEFLIANLELEFFLNIAKSMKYKFLIANKCGFCVCPRRDRVFVPGISFPVPESKRPRDRSTILAGRLKTRIGAIRMTPVKVKSLLCYGGSHFQLIRWLRTAQA